MRSNLDVSRQLADRRAELDLTLAQLARRADTSSATLSRYENGWARFELYTLRKLAAALGCRLKLTLEPIATPKARPSGSQVVGQLSRLFWDCQLAAHHLRDNTLWVVERVLEYGALGEVHLLVRWLGRDEFLDYVSQARLSSVTTRGFWEQILEREGLKCARKYSRDREATFWLHSSR